MKSRPLPPLFHLFTLITGLLSAGAAHATTGYFCEAEIEENGSAPANYSLNYNLDENEVEIWATNSSALHGILKVGPSGDHDSTMLQAEGYLDHAFPQPGYDLVMNVPTAESVERFSTLFITTYRGSTASEEKFTCERADQELIYQRVISTPPPGAMN
ncbi:MAG: hypothetical protein H7301_03450 [Cryobacterium sp.]|nr:hypothetical protein [Oligoflexia bacterium]